MPNRVLSTLFISAALVGTPLVAAADPRPVAAQVAPSSAPKAGTPDEVEGYAVREQQAPATTAEFDGGARGIYIGGGALTLVLVVLLIVLLI